MRYRDALVLSVILAALALPSTLAAESVTWVSDDGAEHELQGTASMFLSEDGAQVFDVSDLAEGETRTFGADEKKVTATRNGNEVKLTIESPEGSHETLCVVDRDHCRILTRADQPDHLVLMVSKELTCKGDEGDCDPQASVDIDVLTGGAGIAVTKIVRSGHPGVVMLHGAEDEIVLKCPEGDTTMHVSEDEAGEVYLCPRHSVPLEAVKGPQIRKIRIETVEEDE